MVLSSVKEDGGLKMRTPQVVWVPGLYPLTPDLQVRVLSARRHDGASLNSGLHAKRREWGRASDKELIKIHTLHHVSM
jgi:hypothetical protein